MLSSISVDETFGDLFRGEFRILFFGRTVTSQFPLRIGLGHTEQFQ